MDNKKLGKLGNKFYCEKCDYSCRDNFNLQIHFKSKKHNRITMDNENKGKQFNCECGKNYMFNSGLYKHKKSCNFIKVKKEQDDELISLVKEQNKKIEKLEQTIKDNPQIQNVTNNNQLNLNNILCHLENFEESINYGTNISRPQMKGRTIFGELVPFDKIWRDLLASLFRHKLKVNV